MKKVFGLASTIALALLAGRLTGEISFNLISPSIMLYFVGVLFATARSVRYPLRGFGMIIHTTIGITVYLYALGSVLAIYDYVGPESADYFGFGALMWILSVVLFTVSFVLRKNAEVSLKSKEKHNKKEKKVAGVYQNTSNEEPSVEKKEKVKRKSLTKFFENLKFKRKKKSVLKAQKERLKRKYEYTKKEVGV